jgi:hypothetical protein
MKLLKLASLLLPLALVWCSSSSPPKPTTLPSDPELLVAPPTGQGFQFRTNAVTVPAGTEEQDCYFFKVSDLAAAGGIPSDQPVELHHIQVVQKEGSHHMNIFRVRTIVGLDPANGAVQTATNSGTGTPQGACFKSSNWADWPLLANMQQEGGLDWTYPDGVSNELQPTEVLMLQTHYVNATTQQTPNGVGKVAVNFWVMPKEQVTAQLGTLFATNQSIRVCQGNPTPTFQQGCQFKGATGPVNVIGANGHFHSRGVKFDMFSWDGMSTTTPPESARFYESLTWDEPPMARSPELNLVVQPGGGVWYSCSYQWQPPDPAIGCNGLNAVDMAPHPGAPNGTPASQVDCCYTFGPLVDKNEHCNAFVYYYPKQDNVNCF